jgi:hypothetical protein
MSDCVMQLASFSAPSDPQTTGPMAGSSDGPTMTAPAPSAKRNAVPRSSGLTQSDSFSTPTSSTYRALPPRIMSLAIASP